ncbi:Glycoside hydrolase family 61 protein [Ceratobasidium theobromae]|uniref:AA9 family lytic polysaccharide monooxygenase n=1 Tax=Ceratobasidium theobromae TaxID=1582974 RepID=A0A5N5QJM7_9AGAM|nr:Glycoside hydrolase family 61 protein [Ceratobasidium theobromae]
MKFSTLTQLFTAIVAVQAHSHVWGAWLDGVDQGNGQNLYIRSPPNTDPVRDLSSAAVACNVHNQPAPKTLKVKAGTTVTFEWFHDARDDEIVASTHKGPAVVYIAPTSSNGTGDVWVKLYEEGYRNGSWAVDKIISAHGQHSIKIPNIAAGQYLLRPELITLHEAEVAFNVNPKRGVQLYMNCIQIEVTTNGPALPAGVAFPGAYTYSNPGIVYNIYDTSSSDYEKYVIPGPAVWSGSAGGHIAQVGSAKQPQVDPQPTGEARKYQQCGGSGWKGATGCVSDTNCTKVNGTSEEPSSEQPFLAEPGHVRRRQPPPATSMSAIANTQPPTPPVEIPPDAGGTRNEDNPTTLAATVVAPGGPERVVSSFPPRLVPYKLGTSPGLRRSSRIAGRALPAPSPDMRNASDQYIEETYKGFMELNKELKEKKHKKGLKIEAQGSPHALAPKSYHPSPLIPVPRSRAPSQEPSPSPYRADQTLFADERLHAKNIDITNVIPPAERQVSLAPPDPVTRPIAPPAPLPGTDRMTPFPHSPLPSEVGEADIAKRVAESMLDIATKDILERLTAPVALEPPGDEKLALPHLLGGPWDRIRAAIQVDGFASEVRNFLNNFNSTPHRSKKHLETTNEETTTPEPAHFAWSGDDVALAMQSAVFAITGEFMSWERALQRASDFDAAQGQHHTPPEGNALGLSSQAPPAAQPPPRDFPPPVQEAAQATKTTTALAAPPPPAKTWAKVAAPKDPKPATAKGNKPTILNTSAIQKELTQIKASKAMPTDTTDVERGEDGWNVQRKGKKTRGAPAPAAALPAGVLPLRRGGAKTNEQGKNADLEVAFKPESPLDIDLVKARANPNESRGCLVRLVKHCNELTSSKEYKDKTDIRVKSFSYSRNGNCIAVFTPKTTIKEVELFAPGLCGVMGLRGTVTVQRTSGWTRMRISHFPAWATDPDTGEWLDRINTREEILSTLQDFAPRELLSKFPPVDVRFFKPDVVVGQCRPGGFETIVVSVDDPTGEAYSAYSSAGLSFGYRNSFVSTHTIRPKIAECRRCCSYQCACPQACSALMRCYKCGERHDPKNHDSRCSQCHAQKLADKPGHVCTCVPRCANCKGAHVFGDPLCPGRLKFATAPAAPFASEYAPVDLRDINPPGGAPWSQASRRTPPTGLISPKVHIEEDEAMAPVHD